MYSLEFGKTLGQLSLGRECLVFFCTGQGNSKNLRYCRIASMGPNLARRYSCIDVVVTKDGVGVIGVGKKCCCCCSSLAKALSGAHGISFDGKKQFGSSLMLRVPLTCVLPARP